jgi:hypothetical protein
MYLTLKVKCIDNYIYLFRRATVTGGRSASMMDLTGGTSAAQQSGREHHLSLVDIRGRATPHMDELLDQGSPSGSDTADPAILDADDSDGSSNTDNVMPMTVDVDRPISIEDPLYHQCKKARRSAFTDRLVSVRIR